jgi:hypothetical protein
MAKPAGFQMCLPSIRRTNLEAIATMPAIAGSHGSSARNRRLSDNPVMSADRRSIRGSPNQREQTACVASALVIASALCNGLAPKSIQTKLIASKVESAAI